MGALDKYKLTTKPPKISRKVAKPAPIDGDLRSWVTRNEDSGLAWVTVKYGPRPVPIKGTAQATIGPVRLNEVPRVFDDVKKAAQAGELDKGLRNVAIQGPRKKKRAKTA
jgi:hypothetical protein